VPTVKYPPKIHAWAGISAWGKGKLFLFKEDLNAALCRCIFTGYMVLPRALNGGGRNRLVMQQDSDPKHHAKVCVAAMGRTHITRMLQPSQRPDLNPLEMSGRS